MTMENVNEIIDSICNKLGTTVEFIMPEYARMAIVGDVVLILVIFAVGYGGYIGLRKLHKFCEEKEHDYDLYLVVAIIIAVIFVIFGVSAIVASSVELTQAIASPHAFFVKAVMEAIK